MEILLYGVVGDPCDGLDAVSLVNAIGQASDDISVRINSLGGLVFDGFAVFNALKQSPKSVTVHIDGIAGSIASIIAMAGDRIIMAENAVMMIHKPSDGTYGVATELRATADRLDMLQSQLVNIYADRTGMTPEELSPLLDAETWMTAQEALAMHFIDEIAGAATATNMLDASKFGFRKVPEHPLIAKATSPAPAATLQNPENIMDPTIDPVTGLPIAAPIVTPPPPTPAITLDQPVNVGDAVAAALTAERSRISTIRNEVSRARLAPTLADTLINDGVSVDAARARIVDAIADGQHTITNIAPASIPAEQFRARADAMSLAIAHRANPRNELTEEARSFAGRRLIVLARDFLDATGVNTRNMGDVEVAQQVFRNRGPQRRPAHHRRLPVAAGQHGRPHTAPQLRAGAADLPLVLSPVERARLPPGLARGTVGHLGDAQVAEGAEYHLCDRRRFGRAVHRRQMGSDHLPHLGNDHQRRPLGLRSPADGDGSGSRAGRKRRRLCDPDQQPGDGRYVALFHASHGNLAGTGTAISIASLRPAGRDAHAEGAEGSLPQPDACNLIAGR
jgi:ATP-dependent Clp endopeptidase proteolytic subunit ClpP